MPKRKVPETLDFVIGLLISADEISKGLSRQIEPRRLLVEAHNNLAAFRTEEIQEMGEYQGRVVLVALAAELALKFAWETENQGGAPWGHDLHQHFVSLSENLKEKIRSEYQRRIANQSEKEWDTADKVFKICRKAFEDWRYIVEEGKSPKFIMRATYLNDATLSVIQVINQ